MAEENKFNFADIYNKRREAELKVWTGDEASYDKREATLIEGWNNKYDEVIKVLRECWDKSGPKDDRITEGEWLVMSGIFTEMTKEHNEGNYFNWTEDDLKGTYKMIIDGMSKQKPDFDAAKGMEFDLFTAQGKWWWEHVKEFKGV